MVGVCDLSPTPSDCPSYRDLSPPPPAPATYSSFVQPGLENEAIDETVLEITRLHQLLYGLAPWTSDPRLPLCISSDCPVFPITHHHGIYFHHGQRPNGVLQAELHQRNISVIFDGGNPPPDVWRALTASLRGESTLDSTRLIALYRRFHCPNRERGALVSPQAQEDRARARRDEQDRLRQRAARQAAEREQTRMTIVVPEAVSSPASPEHGDVAHDPSQRLVSRVQDWAEAITNDAPDDSVQPRPEEEPDHEGDDRDNAMAAITSDENDPGAYPDEGTSSTFDSTAPSATDANQNEDSRAPQGRVITYWSILPASNGTFLNYGLLPPRYETVTREERGNPGCRYREQQEAAHADHTLRYSSESGVTTGQAFLEEVDLSGVFGGLLPDARVFTAFIRLVQEASVNRAADIEMVERFRHLHVHRTRPLVPDVEISDDAVENDTMNI